MMVFISTLGLPEVIAGIIVLALNAYVLMGGADFGGGVWDLFATGARKNEQRQLIASSIGPVWEANHVWLIVVLVTLFTAFPSVFATLGTVLHIPISLMLVGIVLRGSAFVFRGYGSRVQTTRNRWGLMFAVASAVTPLVLGTIIGAIADGAVSTASQQVSQASFLEVFVWSWLTPFAMSIGVFALALFAYLAAVYLALEAHDAALREDFRRRALSSAVAVLASAAVALSCSLFEAPRVAAGVMGSPWSLVLQACTALCATTALVALWRRHYELARIAAAAQVSFILWGWAFAQYPFILPPALTIRAAAAPAVTLRLLLIGLMGGAAILVPSLMYLFGLFAGRAAERA